MLLILPWEYFLNLYFFSSIPIDVDLIYVLLSIAKIIVRGYNLPVPYVFLPYFP